MGEGQAREGSQLVETPPPLQTILVLGSKVQHGASQVCVPAKYLVKT